MESKKINQLATELTPALDDLTIIGDPTTGISKKITLSQMASLFTGTVEEYANLAAFPLVGVADTIYIALDTNVLYRWDTGLTSYVELSPNIINSLVFSDANGFDGTISLVGSTATLTITTALTTGSVPFIGASGALSQDNANLFFDDTNNRLGVNTNVPTTALDVFGSGIIGRLNGTSTNNSFLGFASAGTNKWSIGNVQSDHRFRIYSEANTAELVSVLQTGEFGIGIANPTTKLHIDGGASALIANLDANVSVAKSISFRSDNSARINLEVSGTESGSNAGMDFQIKRYSDAGALIDTPLTITRSTGTLTYSGIINISNSTASSSTTTGALVVTGGVGIGGALYGITGVFNGLVNTTAGNGISAGGNSFAIAPSSTRGVININGSTDQFLTLGSNGYLSGSSTLVRLQSTPDLDFVVGGSQRLLIASSGGKATFNNALAIKAGYAGDKFLFTGAGSGDALGVLYDNAGAAKIQLYTNGNSYFTGGNLGIGFDSPAYKLDVRGAYDASGIISVRSTDSAAIDKGGVIGFGGFHNGSSNQSQWAYIKGAKENSNVNDNASYLSFGTQVSAGSITERLRINSVGTSQFIGPNGGNIVKWTDNANNTGYLYIRSATAGIGADNNFTIETAATERFRIESGGLNTFIGKNAVGNFQMSCDPSFGNYIFNNSTSGGYRNFVNQARATYMLTNDAGTTGMYISNGGSSWNVFSSDIRVKKNFEPSQGLNELLQIEPVKYHLITDKDSDIKRLGFKAQNLLPLIPEMVTTNPMALDDKGKPLYTITPDYLLPVLVKSIQELEARVKQLEA